VTTSDDPPHPFGRTHDDPARCCCRRYPPVRHHPECAHPSEGDLCWHCHAVLIPEPAHCDRCPAPGDCDVEGCSAPGCSDEVFIDEDWLECDLPPDDDTQRLIRAHKLLHRVIEDPNDLDSLKILSRDIRIELYGSDPGADN
jgi:hypothetical protein